jgi:competence protein ComEC
MDADAAALTTALCLGERTGFTDRHWTSLRRTGTTHLVAISGMHVGLIATMTFWIVLRIGLRLPYAAARHAWEAAACVTALVAALYAALAGFAVPTQRALVMLVVVLTVVVAKRSVPRGFGLAAALLVLIFYDPFATLSASFWLSFGAVALLVLLASRERPRARPVAVRSAAARAQRWLGTFVRMQWCITLGLVPLVVAYFAEVSLVSPLVNFVAIPLFSIVLVPLALAAAACIRFGVDGFGIVPLTAALTTAVWQALDAVSAWPWAAVELPTRGAGVGAALLGAVWAALPYHALPGRRLAWIAALGLAIEPPERPAHGVANVTVAEVGHGLAVLVETRHHRLLYDAGPVFRSGFDTGGEIVLPLAKRSGRDDLDLLVLSHGDSDHAGGAGALLEAFPDARLVHGPDVEWPGDVPEVPEARREVCERGRRWMWDGVAFAILHPEAGFAPLGNESSCVLEVRARHRTMLLTGDVEARGERALVRQGSLRADVVVVAHHGSRTSSSQPFVDAVAPRYAIVSAGHDNRWGFPRPEVRARWEARGAVMVVTGDTGAIRLSLGPEPLVLQTARGARKRYWEPERVPVPGESQVGAL